MGIIDKPHGDFQALTLAEAAKVNAQINLLYATVNGEISDPNIPALANINQSKILNLVTDLANIRATMVNEIATQIFTTPGVVTYFKPVDLLYAQIIVVGGGGGGGSPSLAAIGLFRAGGGGGGGGMAISYLLANAIASTEVVTVGNAGGFSYGNSGASGNPSSFGSLVVSNGGAGGAAGLDNQVTQGGSGASGASGQILVNAGDAGFGIASGGGAWHGGHGSASPFGGGGGAGAFAGVGAGVGRNFGGGGGGGIADTNTHSPGAVGGNGIVIVIEYKS